MTDTTATATTETVPETDEIPDDAIEITVEPADIDGSMTVYGRAWFELRGTRITSPFRPDDNQTQTRQPDTPTVVKVTVRRRYITDYDVQSRRAGNPDDLDVMAFLHDETRRQTIDAARDRVGEEAIRYLDGHDGGGDAPAEVFLLGEITRPTPDVEIVDISQTTLAPSERRGA